MEYLGYLAVGSAAGLVSGLFGLGGGTVIVPTLLLVFAAQGVSPEIATHMAIATSLACISVTSVSSIYTHYQKGAVKWSLLKSFIPGVVVGAVVGISLMLFKNHQREQAIPFGPYLAVAGWITLLWGERIWSWYLLQIS